MFKPNEMTSEVPFEFSIYPLYIMWIGDEDGPEEILDLQATPDHINDVEWPTCKKASIGSVDSSVFEHKIIGGPMRVDVIKLEQSILGKQYLVLWHSRLLIHVVAVHKCLNSVSFARTEHAMGVVR